MRKDAGHFSLSHLLRSAKEIDKRGFSPAFKARALWTYFKLIYLGLYGAANRLVCVSGFKIRYCTVESLLYLFREIFVRQVYRFTTASPAPFIIDCGANVGVSIAYFKSLYPAAQVLAFEPDPDAFACLRENASGAGFSGVHVRNEALMGEAGEISLFASASGPGALGVSVFRRRADGPERRVPAVRLSSFIDRPVDLIKMDIEGAETEVVSELRDSGRLAMVRQLLIEYHHHIDPGSDSFSVILEILEKAGFGYQVSVDVEKPFRPGCFQDILVYAYNKR